MTDITEQQITLADLSLAELRRELVAANHEHRALEDELKTARAVAENRAIANSGTYSVLKNEGERARFLTVYLSDNEEYQAAVEAESDARSEVEAIRAEIAIREDAVKERVLAQKDRDLELATERLALDARSFELEERLNSPVSGGAA